MNPNPLLGVFFHWLGGLSSASFLLCRRGAVAAYFFFRCGVLTVHETCPFQRLMEHFEFISILSCLSMPEGLSQ